MTNLEVIEMLKEMQEKTEHTVGFLWVMLQRNG